MESLFAYCGLQCDECPAYQATISEKIEEKEKVAKLWSKEFGVNFTAADINCTGCKSKGVKFSHCGNCEIVKCNKEKELENCGVCDDYPCNKVDHVLTAVPAAKDRLDAVHQAKQR
ncbi:MAG: DUF3795 domain-containing protein [Spirochaetes bacterium]|nr:DUF3795 domain-containing protein [Spirochaetota bacterium]